MATRQQLKDEFLTCIICHEVFRDPVTLHCGHTLCAQCVTAYTKTQEQAIAEKSIICPHCRGLTKAPDSRRPVEEWAGQIKTGFFVKGLVEAVVTDKKDDLNNLCTSCQEDGKTVVAVVWCCHCGHGLCSGCERVHRNLPLLKDHEIIHLSDGNRHDVQTSRKRFPCPKHPDAVIDMMCEDCDVAVCHRCCLLHHRKCDSLIPMEECLPKLKSFIETQGEDLDKAVKKVTEELSVKKSQVEDVGKEAEDAIIAIDESVEKIIDDIREQQKQLKEKVKQAKEERLQSLRADIKLGEMTLEEVKQKQGFIREAVKSDIFMNIYEIYKICKPTSLEHLADVTKAGGKTEWHHMKLKDTATDVLSVVRDKLFSALILYTASPSPIGSTSKPCLVNKISDLQDIWDILVLTVKGIKAVVISSRASGVTSFYQQEGNQKKSNLTLPSKDVLNLTNISSDKAAVALRGPKQIVIFSVNPNLVLDKTIHTGKGYLGLTFLDSSAFAAGTELPGVIDIIDMSGAVLRTFGLHRFDRPVYISCTSDNDILVSDYEAKCVSLLSSTGSLKIKYPQAGSKALQRPWGVACTTGGEIFIADETANTVVQLTDTGKYVRDVLSAADGLSCPRALFVDDDNLMYVSVNHTTIHVYEFK